MKSFSVSSASVKSHTSFPTKTNVKFAASPSASTHSLPEPDETIADRFNRAVDNQYHDGNGVSGHYLKESLQHLKKGREGNKKTIIDGQISRAVRIHESSSKKDLFDLLEDARRLILSHLAPGTILRQPVSPEDHEAASPQASKSLKERGKDILNKFGKIGKKDS